MMPCSRSTPKGEAELAFGGSVFVCFGLCLLAIVTKNEEHPPVLIRRKWNIALSI